MPLLKLFPTQIAITTHRKLSDQKLCRRLVDECLVFRKLDDAGRAWSKKNYLSGYTSYSSITDLAFRSSNFEALKKILDREVTKYARSLDMDLGNRKLVLSSCWINIMSKNCQHSFHLHPLSAISGTFFLQTPPGSGDLKFEDPRLSSFMASPPRKKKSGLENLHFYSVSPKAGDLVLFESWLKHEVTPHQARDERISISFNYDWV